MLLLGFLSGIVFCLAVVLVVVLKLTNIYQGSSYPPPVLHKQFSPLQLPRVSDSFPHLLSMGAVTVLGYIISVNIIFC